MNRRAIIALLGAAAAATSLAWPLAAHAQQPERMRRVGVLTAYAESDPEGRDRVAALRQGLQQLGWIEGGTCTSTIVGRRRSRAHRDCASELVRLAPDVIVTNGTPPTQAVRRETSSIPSYSRTCRSGCDRHVASLVSPGATSRALRISNMPSAVNAGDAAGRLARARPVSVYPQCSKRSGAGLAEASPRQLARKTRWPRSMRCAMRPISSAASARSTGG